jgi:acyl-CoA dehydrogenase
MSDTHTVRAFLEAGHHPWGADVAAFVARELRGRPHPTDDDTARSEARELLRLMGDEGLYEPIRDRDLRACCLARELVAAASPLADAVWALQGLGTTPILLAGTDLQRERWAEPALAGEMMGGFAITEPGAGSDVAAMTTRAERVGDAYVLQGHKWFISNAGIADFYVVFASTDPDAGSRGVSGFVVPADTEGLEYAGPQVMSAPHPLGELRFEGCRVPVDNLLGEEGRGFKLAMMTLDQLRPTVGAAACGMAERALREALGHAVRREQFGKPISDFQLVQEKLGRMAMDLTASRMLVYRAAYEKDLGAERITTEAAMAKAFATEAAQRIIDDAVQILGGRGVMADHPVDLLYRSIRALRIYEGTTEIQHLIIAGMLVAEAKAEEEPSPRGAGSDGGASR